MAKTRSQTRNEANKKKLAQNLKKTIKKNTLTIGKTVLKDCFIRLERIDSNVVIKNKTIAKNAESDVNGYNLRKKNLPVQLPAQKKQNPPKSLSQIVAKHQSVLHTSKAIRIWDELKQRHLNASLLVDQIVCARMAGHRPWPAKVLKFQKNGTQLFFYGTNEIGIVKKAEIVSYRYCKDVIDEYLKVQLFGLCSKTLDYHMKFVKAVKEVSGV